MEESSVECRKCHAEILDGARFCIRCGTLLEGAPSPGTRTLTSRPPAPFTALLSPQGSALASPEPASSLSEAMGNAVEQAEEASWTEAAGGTGETPEITGEARTLSLAGMAADLAAVAKAPSPETDPIRRHDSMVDFSRDELLRRARVKQSMKRAGLAGMDLSGLNLEGVDFGRADLEGANLENAKLRGAILRSANLRGAKLRGADLAQADLDKADLEDAELEGASLEGAQLKRASLVSARLGNANLTGADLTGAELDFADLTGANLKTAVLCFAELTEATLRNVDLSQADARHALFRDAELEGALLHDAHLAGADLSGIRTARVRAERIDVSDAGDGSALREGDHAIAFLRGEEPSSAALATTRYFGKGDVLRDATLEFGKNSVIRIDSRFQNCSIRLSEGAELTIGEEGVLKDCSIVGAGKIIVHGRFFERTSPGIAGARSVVVSSRGGIVSGIEQAPGATVFAFEPGCRLRVKIHKIETPQAAE